MTSPHSIGALFQCYKNPVNTYRALKSFRFFYPTSTVHLINDGGDPIMEKIAKRFNCIYWYKENIASKRSLIYNDVSAILEMLRRIWQVFHEIEEDHVILLEDDVRILRRHSLPFKYSINGCNFHTSLFDELKVPGKQVYYGGCGGAVFDKNFFLSIPFDKIEKMFLEKPEPHRYPLDMVMTCIALTHDGSVGQHEEFAEIWYGDYQERLRRNMIAFLHAYKNEYGDSFREDELKDIDTITTELNC